MIPPRLPNGVAAGCRDGELTQGERLNALTPLCQPGVKGAQRSVLTEIFSIEPEREAIAMACSTLIHLDLKQGAIANALLSPQGDGATTLSPKRTGTATLAAPQRREVMPSLLLDLPCWRAWSGKPCSTVTGLCQAVTEPAAQLP